MARINGINSDFAKSGDSVAPVEPADGVDIEGQRFPQNLYMKLFICPYNEPTRLEADGDVCEGINQTCPNGAGSTGHAHIELNEEQGVMIGAADEDQIQVNQDGQVRLTPSDGQNVRIQGNVLVLNPNGTSTVIDASGSEVVIFANNGGVVTINSSGAIAINGNVTIEGNLTVNGIFMNTP